MAKIPVKTEQENNVTTESLNNQDSPELQTPESPVVEDSAENRAAEILEGEDSGLSAEEQEAPQAEKEEPERDELAQLRQELKEKAQQVQEHYEARLRLQAEFDNFKKRKERELSEFRKYANESFVQEILLIVDDFERAVDAAEQTHKLEDFLKGVELILEKLQGVLKKKGVKEIEAEGQAFNPEIHEAITQIATDDVEEGTVVSVFQKGYYLHDRVIRAPKVSVATPK